MCHDGAKGLVSPETAAALDALLQLAIEKASETLMSGGLEPKDAIAAVKIIAEASKAAAECVAKGNGIMRAPPAVKDGESSALRGPIYTFNDAVTAVCELDPETAYLEPWARLLSRINRLFQRVQKDVEEINSDRACMAGTCAPPSGDLATAGCSSPNSSNTRESHSSPRSPRASSGEPDSDLPGVELSSSTSEDARLENRAPVKITQSGEKAPPTQSSDSPFMSQSELNMLRSRAPT